MLTFGFCFFIDGVVEYNGDGYIRIIKVLESSIASIGEFLSVLAGRGTSSRRPLVPTSNGGFYSKMSTEATFMCRWAIASKGTTNS